MILSGKEILEQKSKGNIIITPFDEKKINPNSYNLTLHDEILVYENKILDSKVDNKTQKVKIPKSGFLIDANRLYLGKTVEYTETHGFAPCIDGRSSWGRLGLSIHVTAGFGDVGFSGCWTLEIYAIQPIIIYPFTEICQIYYHTVQGELEEYKGKYNSCEIQNSKIYTELK